MDGRPVARAKAPSTTDVGTYCYTHARRGLVHVINVPRLLMLRCMMLMLMLMMCTDLEVGGSSGGDKYSSQQSLTTSPANQVSINFLLVALVVSCFLGTMILFLVAGAPTAFLGRLT
jgi:hypothetical protein